MRPCSPVRTFAGALALALVGGVARADSAAPRIYRITITGSSVQICADPYYPSAPGIPGRPCPDQGLLRRDPQSGEAVRITSCDASQCFVDECVPPGAYQYGLQDPLDCGGAEAAVYFYETATLTGDVQGCGRSTPEPGPYTGDVPWMVPVFADPALRCKYGSDQGCSCSSGGLAILTWNALALAVGVLLLLRRRRAAPPS